jgi:hypothetical protein
MPRRSLRETSRRRTTRPAVAGPVAALLASAPRAFADHGGSVGRPTDASTGWWLALAVVLVLAAVGWALFGPGAHEPDPADETGPSEGRGGTPPLRSDPE